MNNHERRLKVQRKQERIERKNVYKGADIAVNALCIIPCYVLRTKFGFGNERIERFITEFFRLWKLVCKRDVEIRTLAESLEAETGIKIDGNSEVWNLRKEEKNGR